MAAFAGPAEAQLPNGIPNLCASPTITSVRTGSWSDPGTWSIGQVPTVNDRVSIAAGTTITYDRQSDADIVCISVNGQLTFRNDMSTRLTVGTLMVMPGGGLQIGSSGAPIAAGVTAEIVISDRPLDTGIDPEQFGTGLIGFGRVTMHGTVKSPTFVRLASEAGAGQASLSLASAPSGWKAGDKIVVPGTNQSLSNPDSYQGQWETPTLSGISGSQVSLSSGLAFSHLGGRDAAGALAFLPHIGNISRNIIIRSANPSGTRGHVLMTDRAEVDIRYVAFKDLGRTTISPLDSTTLDSGGHATHIGSNQIGRYSLHMHHLFGPAAPPPNSYQFVLIGNAVDGGTKWGITIHNTHYGLVQDNVVYNAAGAGIMTEDGSETANVIQNNFIVRAWGTGHERADGRSSTNDWGWEGSGIWLRGPDNIVRNNVVANANSYAVTFMMLGVGNVLVPNNPGDNPKQSGHAVNMMAVPLREFSSNEFYSVNRGITVWNLGANCCEAVYDVPVSTFLNTKMWHVGVLGFYGYGENRVTFDGWVHYNDPAPLMSPHESAPSFYFGDYIARNIVIRQADIQGLKIGVFTPIKAGDTRDMYGNTPGTLTIENSVLKNYWNIYTGTPYGVTGGGSMIPPRLVIARNVQFANVPGASDGQGQAHVYRNFTPSTGENPNIIVPDRVVVESFNGNSADNFEVFAASQASSFIIPSTSLTSQVAGMTNAQAWTSAGIAISGTPAPCSNARTGIVGFVCPAGSLPSLPPAPTSPTPTPTPAPPPSTDSGGTTSPPPPSTGSGTGTSTSTCTTPDPFVSLGGGTCVNGGWLPPSITTAPTPAPKSTGTGNGNGTGNAKRTGCSTPDPFKSLGGGTCVNGGWLPPNTSTSTPTSPAPTSPTPPPPTSGSTGCTTPDPFVSLGGGTCSNGGWLPPTNPAPAPTSPAPAPTSPPITGDDSDGDGVGNARDLCPGTTRGAVVDANGCPITTTAPVAPAPTSPTPTPAPAPSNPTPGACPGTDPFAGLVGLVGVCVNGGWVPVPTTTTEPAPTLPPITGDDSDGDGVGNLRDLCPGTTRGVAVDANGCPVTTTAPIAPTPPTTTDSDGDGVPNTTDQCPGTAAGMPVDTRGCPIVSSSAPPPPSGNTIVLNPSVKYQTISGWEGAVLASISDFQGLSDAQLSSLLALAVDDLGLTRARLAIRSGAENPNGGTGYDIVNDNSDPFVINPNGFKFTTLDYQIDRFIVPLRQRAQARGESFYVNLNYVDFGQSAFEHYNDPQEYAEFMVATFQHMRDKYGFVPNGIEVMLEPNDVSGWSPTAMGQCIVATAQRLQAAGFSVPEFIAPSTSNMSSALTYIDGIMAVPGAAALVKEFSYHRYGASLADLQGIAARGVQYGKRTSMLEYWTNDGNYRVLHQDLTTGRNSAWQQGQFADSYGCQYNQVVGIVNGAPTVCPNTKFIRQYTKYVRPGAQRIDAAAATTDIEPIAFINSDGRYVVVVKSETGGSFSISGLPAGTYGIYYTTNAQYDVNLSAVTIAAGQSISSSIPATGVITIYRK